MDASNDQVRSWHQSVDYWPLHSASGALPSRAARNASVSSGCLYLGDRASSGEYLGDAYSEPVNYVHRYRDVVARSYGK